MSEWERYRSCTGFYTPSQLGTSLVDKSRECLSLARAVGRVQSTKVVSRYILYDLLDPKIKSAHMLGSMGVKERRESEREATTRV